MPPGGVGGGKPSLPRSPKERVTIILDRTGEDSETECDSEVVLPSFAQGTWGLGHTFFDKLNFTSDIPKEKWTPYKLEAPTFL